VSGGNDGVSRQSKGRKTKKAPTEPVETDVRKAIVILADGLFAAAAKAVEEQNVGDMLRLKKYFDEQGKKGAAEGDGTPKGLSQADKGVLEAFD